MIALLYRLADAARRRTRSRLWTVEQANGRLGEDLAHRHLQREGLRVVARNYRPRAGAGEIDLIAWDTDTLVFVEVKARTSGEYGAPDRAVDHEKRRDLEHAAADYARRAGVPWEQVRFDVVNVVFTHPARIWRIRDAFRPSRTL